MRVVVQRCKRAEVTVNGASVGQIEQGLMLLVGITHDDTEQDAKYIADKVAGLRIFEDETGKMNLSVLETGGQILSVSQFTLYGDCRKGKRPNFMSAARPEIAQPLYDKFNELLRAQGLQVETGAFGEMMDVSFTNWGPVTLIIDSK
ncbi:D-tyrosyl-tRNA(Tyr) deacylase [Paenibacillus sp. CGMCC 1.16610]|uniref:D-aminoacyl-tRNA deacylase n=2 Tax=Paenibacillus TaxID=44249 RepID=A0ABU6DCX6_9BACL|nr:MULTISPECIES: D-aminoacyl-tRNA deacylase [Paenibacillus]MBA2939259.1 D-tyrosyl-tRNA(Tyr) deacylase [Paenibacillus sp. CGMCC 1.16610]MCY9661086.1 D-aminoacyl-tRNA deacylase [Paenibacillus anseongense]MEB4794793.1 D-aminoacyl-tRNA deacylase [Paenibacillus chondroitinus]MVQ35218.1 D-tyrosyl-tRNA(Tyr) deacylase [Paenibacillus anseongense]